ncbi:winged helix-turn-helix domain-containing protein [Spirillospora sp. NBC_01491]|uniref:winged helix-turn-helix domain-containing protein n=1 Tax=Spirillospora sp. NBC_01491 TaxID=2976007 RepID=UPI002E33BDCC|nr:winged helix-turn-helix domain-containing protein [Spirillospora sp. NBC_01491]
MCGRLSPLDGSRGPSHRHVADDIRTRIGTGEYPIGMPIPSTVKLTEHYSVSKTVIRQAVAQLQQEGLLEGHGGKGVFVLTTPAEQTAERVSVEDLAQRVNALSDDLRDLATRITSIAPDRDLAGEVTELRGLVVQLYNRLGHPLSDESAEAPASPRRRDTGT